MNYIKAQKDVFNKLVSGNRGMGRFSVDEHNILISPDGYMGYIFPLSSLVINIEKIKEMEPIPFKEIVKEENELKLTPDLRILDRSTTARRLKGKDKNTFVNIKFLEHFQNPRFFQEASNLGLIVVTECFSAKDRDVPVGVIRPIRCSFDDGSYYGDIRKAVQ